MNIDPILYNTIVVDICIGDRALIQGGYQLSSGNFIDTLTGLSGCDSIVTTSLVVHDTSFISNTYILCYGDSVLSGSNYKNTTGIYYDTLPSIFGCDSVVVTDLTVLDSIPVLLDTLEICAGDSANIGGSYFDTAGTYYETYTTAQGCDSVVEISLEI